MDKVIDEVLTKADCLDQFTKSEANFLPQRLSISYFSGHIFYLNFQMGPKSF